MWSNPSDMQGCYHLSMAALYADPSEPVGLRLGHDQPQRLAATCTAYEGNDAVNSPQ